MPLSALQVRILALLAENRSESSYLAGATGIHMASGSTRRSMDLDLFHDREQAVANAFANDRRALEGDRFSIRLELSQPGFIRAIVSDDSGEALRIDWAHDSMWRFLPPVMLEDVGYVLHPVDLSVNKVLALAGRDEPRDFVDIMYLHHRVLPLGALCWAACGKDPGMNPEMLLELLARKGRYRQIEVDRLDLTAEFDVGEQIPLYRQALRDGREWAASRPPDESGCLYRRPGTGLFFAPEPGEEAEPHLGAPGGVLPGFTDRKSLYNRPAERAELEAFFERKLKAG